MITEEKFIRFLIIFSIGFYLSVQIYCIYQTTPNIDETAFAEYGRTILRFQGKKDIAYFDSKLPITALNSLPRVVEQVLNPNLKRKDWGRTDLYNGRYVSLLATILLALLIYQWAKEMYGRRSALFSFAFFLLCPNFLAHGIFVGTDIYAALFLTSSFYFLWKYERQEKIKYFLLFSAAVGLAQISKFQMILLFTIIPLLLLIQLIFSRRNSQTFNIIRIAILILVFLFTNWIIISLSHLFYEECLPLSSYHFISEPFRALQNLFSPLPIYLPLPSSYINSLDYCIHADNIGGGLPGSLNNAPYILGRYNTKGFWYYYFITLLFKMPLPALFILIASVLLVIKKRSQIDFFRNELYLFIAAIFYFIYLSFFYTTQIGIRHILIILPSIFILFSHFFRFLILDGRERIIYVMLLYELVSVASYFPHFLPYTNEFITNKKLAYKRIGDTNINYGEGKIFLKKYLDKHPEAIYMPERPISGKVVLDVNEILNLKIPPVHKYDWAKVIDPIDHIHSQYLVFNLSKRMADSLQNSLK